MDSSTEERPPTRDWRTEWREAVSLKVHEYSPKGPNVTCIGTIEPDDPDEPRRYAVYLDTDNADDAVVHLVGRGLTAIGIHAVGTECAGVISASLILATGVVVSSKATTFEGPPDWNGNPAWLPWRVTYTFTATHREQIDRVLVTVPGLGPLREGATDPAGRQSRFEFPAVSETRFRVGRDSLGDFDNGYIRTRKVPHAPAKPMVDCRVCGEQRPANDDRCPHCDSPR